MNNEPLRHSIFACRISLFELNTTLLLCFFYGYICIASGELLYLIPYMISIIFIIILNGYMSRNLKYGYKNLYLVDKDSL